jgi:hypothetical protein
MKYVSPEPWLVSNISFFSKSSLIRVGLIIFFSQCVMSAQAKESTVVRKSTPRQSLRDGKIQAPFDDLDMDLDDDMNLESHSPAPQKKPKLVLPLAWAAIPSEFIPYLKPVYGFSAEDIEYETTRPFLRQFRMNQKYTYDQPSIRAIDWSELKLSESSLPPGLRDCWNIFMSGGFCGKSIPAPKKKYYTERGTLDILKYVRWVSKKNGLVVGRQVLEEKLAEGDASHGELKGRILKTTEEKSFVYPDSFSTIPQEERKDIGVYLVLGIGGENSPNAALVKNTADEINAMGFQSEMLKVDANLGSDYNALLLQTMISERLPKIKKAVFVAVSKGAADFITYFLNYGGTLPLIQREKVKLMVTLSGVIRPSVIAKYVTESSGLIPSLLSGFLRLSGRSSMLEGLKSLGKNPWKNQDQTKVHKLFPNMKWLSMPTLPEGDEAVTHLSLWEGFLKAPAYKWAVKSSPMDGLVESAASVLPPDTDIPEYIVPVYGPHAMALGFYNKTLRVAPVAMKDIYDRVIPEAGGEVLNAIFRALPQELVK